MFPAPRPRLPWKLRTRTLSLGADTLVMGILNVTPDSFSDGGSFFSPESALKQGLKLLEEGAHILDIGAESTRPNADPLSPMQEQARLLPVLEALRRARPDAILSVDTYHASTARHALDAGAEIINDVSGLLWDEFMASTLAAHPPLPGLVVMHTRGTPQQWHTLARLDPPTVAPLVVSELTERTHFAKQSGIPLENICVDPGFGFGKLGHENYALLAHLRSLQSLRRPILAGLSRKGFLAHALSSTHRGSTRSNTPPPASRRLYATLAANTAAILAGAHIVRVHDIAAALEAASVADSILAAL